MIHDYYKSDKRIKGGVAGKCKLCLKNKDLKLSHIAPKWMFKWAKNETEKGIMHGYFPSLNETNIISQDGSKTYLLCGECEQFLGIAENYVKDLQTNKTDEINYELIQRFLAGTALKAHYTNAAPFHNITFRKEYIRFFRESLFEGAEPNPHFLIAAIIFESYEEIDSRAIIVPGANDPKSSRTQCFSLLGGGWEWYFFIDRKKKFNDFLPPHLQKSINENIINPSGETIISKASILDHRFVTSFS